jgi:hypothetical protein
MSAAKRAYTRAIWQLRCLALLPPPINLRNTSRSAGPSRSGLEPAKWGSSGETPSLSAPNPSASLSKAFNGVPVSSLRHAQQLKLTSSFLKPASFAITGRSNDGPQERTGIVKGAEDGCS